MDSYASRNRSQRHRQPLVETTNWVNVQTSTPPRPPPPANTSSPPSSIPHHESLKPGGTLQTRNSPPIPPPLAVVNKRVSAISGQEKRNANRDSQISTASTNTSGISRRRKTHVGPWQLGKTIGKGSSGRVRKARHALTGQDAAIKIVSKTMAEHLRTSSLAHMEKLLSAGSKGKRMIPFGIEREVVIMKLIEHPNIISLYDVWENRGELYLVLEYVEGGELFEHISSYGQLPEHEAIRIFRQIIAGLSYCHRFNICHRDLKPENILLDRNHNIKIVDFGMAVLQPANRTLKTSCGSPHYAPPEVIRAVGYRGDRADIWSCGVILYAMLAGCLPFDSPGDWSQVVASVLRGEYQFPEGMSAYAQDLIYRMLQMDPRKRIAIKHMWQHPLLQRYEHLDPLDANGQPYIGPLPNLTSVDCGKRIRNREEIDVELLGNLQNLYHGISEDELMEKLLNDEPNHEKVLYTKLLNYREEQLENYQGTIEYSASDYHHKPNMEKPHRVIRSWWKEVREGASVIGGHRCRANKVHQAQLISDLQASQKQKEATTLSVLLERKSTKLKRIMRGSRFYGAYQIGMQRPTLQSPVEDQFSIVSTPPAAHSSQLARLRNERRVSRASSRLTFSSSTGTRVVHKSASYRRGVSFAHSRKRSASADIHPSRYSSSIARGVAKPRASSTPLASLSGSPQQTPSSPNIPAGTVRSKKPVLNEGSWSKPRITSQYWKEDTRKVSKELENFCDEAFNRVSVASSAPTTITAITDYRSCGTPATSQSIHDNFPMPNGGVRRIAKSSDLKAYEDRPLPQPPVEESLGSFTHRELAKTKQVLMKRAAGSGITPGALDEVIAHLDRLMQPSEIRLLEENRRAVSTPDQGLAPNKDTFERFLERADVGLRSASEPTAESPRKRHRQAHTIRIVDDRDNQKDISPVKPLTIRKKSNSSTPSTGTLKPRSSQEQLPQPNESKQSDRYQPGERRSAGLNLLQKSLEPIEEHADDREKDEPKPRTVTKKKSWFFRGHQANKSQDGDNKMPPPPFPPKDQAEKGFQNLGGRKEIPAWKRASDPASETSQNSESKKEGTTGKARLLKLFGKKELRSKRSSQELSG
ncbi:MAG: hypothetical protein Q9211_001855, partial [Gyalolechia sp. 1 TL-2023]